MIECLADRGIAARPLPDGGIEFGDIPRDQAVAQRAAIDECRQIVEVDPRLVAVSDQDELEDVYRYLTGPLTECLEAQGFRIGEPPTFDAFLEQLKDPDEAPWHPYTWVDPPTREAWERINELCPQEPVR